MNIVLLNKLVNECKMSKTQIAEMAEISRTTLDNALNGADIKISTVESLANVLGVSPSIFFGGENTFDKKGLNMYEREIKRLQTLLDNQQKSTKVIVELELTQDEFIKMGLKDKAIRILNR